MHYPLTAEQFQSAGYEMNMRKDFITAFIRVINNIYEKSRKAERTGLCFTPDLLKEQCEKEYGTECNSREDNMFFDVLAEYANDACRRGAEASRDVEYVSVDAIGIYPCFAAHEPEPEKMQRKERYFLENGVLQSQIILDGRGNLIDGFSSYLLAKKYGVRSVPVRYGKRQIIRANHKPGGKQYSWELPGLFTDRVFPGDKVLVRTERGVKAVTVAAVEEYAGNGLEPLRMAIRVKRKGGVVND